MTTLDIRKIIATLIPASLRKYVAPKIARHLYFKGTIPVRHRGEKLLKVQATGYFLENEILFYGLEVLNEKVAMKLNEIFSGLDFRFFNINDSQNTVRKTDSIGVSDQYNYFVVKPSIVTEMRSLKI